VPFDTIVNPVRSFKAKIVLAWLKIGFLNTWSNYQ
jgi:hypothetical protein